ncbi:MAG TPA: hypothetical protein VFH14_08005, partial [Gemmatimonadaceae bacterium]|nr:hypothetical protein [Gemmatimonadaceae bacterium]
MAVSALVVSLSLTSLVGSAAASPSAEDTRGCSVLAHERNLGAHKLHEAWQGFNEQLRGLSREARELSRESRRSSSATTLTVDARADLADAKSELNAIRGAAHAELQELVELGTVCKDPVVTESEDPHITLAALVDTEANDEDGTVTVTLSVQFNEEVVCSTETDNGAACKSLFTYMASSDADPADAETFELSSDGTTAMLTFELDEDVEVDGSKDELKLTSGGTDSLKDTDTEPNTVDTETETTVELSLQTNDLVMKYREVVDQAILDMQAVMDPLNAAVAEMLEAAATAETTDDAAVTEKHGKAKADREAKEK